MTKELLLLLSGAAMTALVGVVAYFAKRRIEGTAEHSRLERRSKALALHKEMTERGLTIADVDAFEDQLTKRHTKAGVADEVAAELAINRGRAVQKVPRPGESQSEANVLAAADVDIAQAMLSKAIHELIMSSPEHADVFDRAQKAWKRYAEAEAKAVSAFCEGGSMYPSAYAVAMEQLTVSRIADVRDHAQFLRSLQ